MKNLALLPLLWVLSFPIYAQNVITQTISQVAPSVFEEVELMQNVADLGTAFRMANPALSNGITFEMAELEVNELLLHPAAPMRLQLPLPEGGRQNLLLVPSKSQSSSFAVYNQDGVPHTVDESQAQHYWGIVEGESRSVVAISIFQEQIMGSVISRNGTYHIAALKNDPHDRHLIYREEDLDATLDFTCGVESPRDFALDQEVLDRSNSNPDNCVLMYVEVDFDITQDKGGVANTTDYVTGLFNQITLMYFNESINLNLHELVVWDEQDPYTGPSTSQYLSQFRTETGLDFNGDLAHLLGYEGGGGIASLDVLCNTFFSKHGYSGINPTFNEVPVFSWSVLVVTHELGHNLGSPHTHDCVWNGNNTAIDRCGIEAGYGNDDPCNLDAGLPEDGTVMSYCHLNGVGIDLALGFGPQPGDLIRDRVYNAECLVPCEPRPEVCDDEFDNDFDGLTDCEDPDCAEFVGCLPCEQNIINFSLTFDSYPSETSWQLTDESGTIIESGSGYNGSDVGMTISEEFCLDEACYTLTIFDSFGDGICCNHGDGNFELSNDEGTIIASGGTFSSEISVELCNGLVPENCFDGVDNDLDGLIDCEDPDCGEEEVCIPCMENVVNLILTYDDYPEETSWEILDDQGEVLFTGAGSMDIPDGSTVQYDYCLPDGCYDFRILDSQNDGICCFFGLGNYVLQSTTGEVYAAGGEFASEETTNFCTENSLCPQGTTFVVSVAQDSVAGSLRQAINCANALVELDTIVFDLAEDDTLFINGSLPTLVDDNIIIDGGGGRVIVYDNTSPLFTIASGFNTIRGFDMYSARAGFGRAVLIESTASNFQIRDNHMEDFREMVDIRSPGGLVRNNTMIGFNFQRIITILATSGQVIVDSNTISSNGGQGIGVYLAADDIQVRGNELFNLRNGVQTSRANQILIEGNILHDNWWGVNIDGNLGDGQSHRISQNSFYCNLFNNGINLTNEANANKLPPVLTSIEDNSLFGTANPGDEIEVYISDDSNCSTDVPCQGTTYLSTTFADPDGVWLLENLDLVGGEVLTAIAIDTENNSSSFAECLQFIPSCPEVTLSLVANPTTLCPEDSVQLYLSSDEPWFGTFSWQYEANGDLETVDEFRLLDTLVLFPTENTDYRILSAVGDFECQLELGNTEVQVDVLEPEDLIGFASFEICPGEIVNVNEVPYSEPGLYETPLISVNGCDSLLQFEIILLEEQFVLEDIVICEGDEIEIFGNTVTDAGSYEAIFTGENGCDSTHIINLSLIAPINTEEDLQICAGESIELFGQEVNTSGEYSGSFLNVDGCDSTHTVNLTVVETIETSEALSLCEGETVEVFGEQVSEAGVYEASFVSSAGCDSVHQITVTLIDAVNTTGEAQICDGETIELFGEIVSEAGQYTGMFLSSPGCDSTHTITLTILEPAFSEETIQACAGETVLIFGEPYTDDALVSETFTGINGCDSTHTIQLTFNEAIETNEMLAICEGDEIELFGSVVTEAGTYSAIFIGTNGCDSTHFVDLSLIAPISTEEDLQICEGETIDLFGQEVSTSGEYNGSFLNIDGCDSTHTVNLTVVDIIETMESLPLCDGSTVEVFGETVSEAGVYEASFVSAAGCDSVHQITVILIEDVSTNAEAQICEGETIELFGEIVSEAGEYSATFLSSQGCDSTHTVTLTVAETAFIEETIQACTGQSVTIFGEVYTDDVLVSETFIATNGCDSTHTVELIFTDLIETGEMMSICEGESVLIFGQQVSTAGTYTEEFVTTEGCDSVHTIDLMVLDHIIQEDFLNICEGESILIFGNEETTAGTYEATFTASNGCDSTQVFQLEVLEASFFQEVISICNGESAEIFGETQTEAGTYTAMLTAANGCDSVATIELVIFDLPNIEAFINGSCENENDGSIALASDQFSSDYQWAHTPENTPELSGLSPGNYIVTVTDDNLCESVWEYEVEALPTPEYNLESTPLSCGDDMDGIIQVISDDPNLEVSFAGGAFGSTVLFDGLAADTYTLVIRTDGGCEAEEQVTLDAPESIVLAASEIEQPSCEGEQDGSISLQIEGGNDGLTFMWSNGLSGPTISNLMIGAYTVTITNANGCDLESSFDLPGAAPIDANLQLLLGCGDGQIIAVASPSDGQPPYEVNWSDSQTGNVAVNLTAGFYSIELTDANGCDVTENFEIPYVEPFSVAYNSIDPSCADSEDGSIDLLISGGIPPYDISWTHEAEGPNLDNLANGTYTYNVVSEGCGRSASVTLTAPPYLEAEVEFTVSPQQNLQGTALVNGGTPPYSFQWSNGSGSSTVLGLQEGQEIGLTITDANGCVFTETFVATITNTWSVEAANLRIFPNPTAGQLFIEHTNQGWSYGLRLYSIDGVEMTSAMDIQSARYELSTQDLPPGTYLLVLSNENFRRVERIVVIP
ncbi:MAG: M12 family metallo-peptidase [Bacteroidota bacterium]